MAANQGFSPFELLLDIDAKSRQHASGFPAVEEPTEEWVGIAFELRETRLLAPMSDVTEVVAPPKMAHIPGVKPWVMGIANLRGTLLPIMDLQGFIFANNSLADPRNQRVLVISQDGVSAGLLVDAVLGLKHFWADDRAEEFPAMDEELRMFTDAAYRRLDEHYAVFSVTKLIQSEPFLDVAT